MTRRNVELILLVIAGVIITALFGTYALTESSKLTIETLIVPLGIFAAFLVAHIAIRKLAPAADPAILPIVLALTGIGITFITRLAYDLAFKQVIWLLAGVLCMILTLIIVKNLSKIANYKYTFMILGFVLLLCPLIPVIGQEIYGSKIWISIGPLSFQPGEIAKICIVLFLAGYLAQNREMLSIFTWRIGPLRFPDLRTLMPLLLMWAVSLIIVIFEKDLGSALVFYFVFLIMLYVASGKKLYLVIGLLLAVIAGVFLYTCFGHVQTRVETWLDPFSDASAGGYQLVQSLYSLADGGLFGTGIGRGLATQIPVVESDFIFIAIAEELGLMGGAAVLLLFLCFAIRGFLSAARAKNDVSSFVAVGLTTLIVFQAFIIVGGVTKLIPLTGLTLPFISQGGSSLLASFIAVGFLLRCGDEGTGIEKDLLSTSVMTSNGVLGRVSLGKRLTWIMIFFSLLFAILVANLTYIMIFQADEIKHMPSNNHVLLKEQYNKRGSIQTKDGTVLAKSVKNSDGTYDRQYPAGTLASNAVGYASTKFGTSGLEQTYNDTLKGEKNFATWQDVLNNMMGKTTEGNDITLSLNTDVQKAAENALAGRKGACVVIDSGTGGVMACASSPTYDANQAEKILSGQVAADDSAMFNRATQALYAPGSTFKIVSLTTALAEGVASEDSVYNSPGVLDIGGGKVTNYERISYGNITLRRATEVSSNTVYAQVGEQLNAERLVNGSKKFLFNQKVDFDIPLTTSVMPDPKEMTLWETAWASAGEPVGEHKSPAGPQATTLEMALVGCAIANNGVINQPYMLDSIRNPSGEVSYSCTKKPLAEACTKEVATRVRKVLEGVVTRGTGTEAAIKGVNVAGKTGTAEKDGGNRTDSWFVGFDSLDQGGSAVVALVLEDSKDAPAKAQNVLKVALQKQGLVQ